MPKIKVEDSKGLYQTSGTGGLFLDGTGAGIGFGLHGQSKTGGTLAVTHSTNYDIALTQPAGTIIKDLICIPQGDIVTNGSSGHDFDISIGAASSYTDLLAATALLDNGGGAVTWKADVPLYIFENSHGQGANAFATGVAGPKGGPATTEAIVVAGALYSSAERTINVRFKQLTGNLATAATTITVVMVCQYLVD